MHSHSRDVLNAIVGSIRKWEAILKGTGGDKGPKNCPLCKMYFYKYDVCRGCPVMEQTGQPFCRHTPYSSWQDNLQKGEPFPYMADSSYRKALARDEVRFLKRLRTWYLKKVSG